MLSQKEARALGFRPTGCGQYIDPNAEPNIDKRLPAKRLTTRG